ncbi:acyltransferase [Curtobacterium sp. MCPF17_011]|uniref:acyltransferase family protein n=1 Tax=Curtobacterium sp. MCPF17_011 TaxID=2175652 RepID=UPI0015E8BD98|nr:acyltransferase [Curtobacterium sp. MCPF17_011]
MDSLTGLRFYAAFAVLLCHAVPRLAPVPVLSELSEIGAIGVGFFFVLSGFILAWTWRPTDRTSHFWVKRFARIYPLHLATLVAAVVLASLTGANNWMSVAASVPLLQAWGPESWRAGGNGPSWSLSVEMFFYLVFPFVIRPLMRTSGRHRLVIAAAVVIAMAVWNAGYFGLTRLDVPNAAIVSSYTNPLYRLGEFVLGIIVAGEFRAGWRPRVRLGYVVALGAAWYALLALANSVLAGRVGLSTLPYGLLDLAFLPVSVALIVAAAASDLFGLGTGLRGRVHVALGQWSFALYLIQMLVITAVVHVFGEKSSTGTGLPLLGWVIVTCVALSGAVFRFVERPAERMLRQALLPQRGPGLTTAPPRV